MFESEQICRPVDNTEVCKDVPDMSRRPESASAAKDGSSNCSLKRVTMAINTVQDF